MAVFARAQYARNRIQELYRNKGISPVARIKVNSIKRIFITKDNSKAIPKNNYKYAKDSNFGASVRPFVYFDPPTLLRSKLYFDQKCASTCNCRPIRSPDLTKGRSKEVEVQKRSNWCVPKFWSKISLFRTYFQKIKISSGSSEPTKLTRSGQLHDG